MLKHGNFYKLQLQDSYVISNNILRDWQQYFAVEDEEETEQRYKKNVYYINVRKIRRYLSKIGKIRVMAKVLRMQNYTQNSILY